MSRISLKAIPIVLLLTAILFLTPSGCIERKPERLARRDSPVSSDLRDMAQAQEEMRTNPQIDQETYKQTMIVFRNRVYDLVAQALVREPEDLARAAQVLLACDLAGGDADCLLAFYLAKNAADKGMEDARPLAARCVDRYLVRSGQAQRFGTQMIADSLGNWMLAPVDPNTTDSERAAWGVPSLEELMQQGVEGEGPDQGPGGY